MESGHAATREELPAGGVSFPPRGIERLFEKAPYLTESERDLLKRAYEYAELHHQGQKRSSGDDYITHPVAVAEILAGLHLDAGTLAAALLHDVVEDTKVTDQEVRKQFGPEIASLVDGVTKLKRLRFESREQAQAENLRKMFLAMAKDVRVVLVKLADRLHNMRTIKYRSPDKQRKTSEETLEIFAPLAHRLGMSAIQWELEDISLRHLEPQQYYRIVNLMAKKRTEREMYVQQVIDDLKAKLEELSVRSDLSGRAKHIYSIYKKMTELHKEFSEIYDLFAVRVIVDSVKDCYAVLGIVHTMWKPIPGRFKDYVAMPKANLYQSLHTTVIGPNGEPLEIQIRTWEMHRTAEYGIAAHWIYKEQNYGGKENAGKPEAEAPAPPSGAPAGAEGAGVQTAQSSFAQKLAWFREVVEWQQDFRDAHEFMETLKIDLFADEVFVFTPKGDVIELPAGSCPIDFAYRIHTDVGNRCVGAKVNGRIVPLDTRLRTGDIVEILTSKLSYGPSQDWLKIAQSSQARAKIRLWFKKERRDENVEKGRELLEKEIAKNRLDPHTVMVTHLPDALARFNFAKPEDLFASIGYGAMSPTQVMTRILERMRKTEAASDAAVRLPTAPLHDREKEREQKKREAGRKGHPGVQVKGIDNLLIRFSRCCNPVPGDDIVGFVTRGRGVSVHRKDCPNVAATLDEGSRMLEVEWASTPSVTYNVDIEVTAMDRRGLINEVMNAVVETKTDITAVTGRSDKRRMATIHLSISIRNLDHLRAVVDRIKRIKDIYAVRRVIQ